ncbi:putative adenosine monophosphate-protein transferase Fic [Erwiniaceae bacterium BAC15a-03b]|uniref:protein adenylyltransferase n=1 Tax=Winslowiella arboricola TaxID=2978220 RepID=A0A9J6PGN8_9GAMM|nr:putative adenosine monophosphate-protein transferase Fic [Winslowiella arboricola]MCU5771843.1 putative adenosine monophosphate-protein transferase Fic [Winslowiella arboricola]MCU5777473.1 putative adenosine monophosphate-protein transferase Fic [Winslowiella arboricola]
MSANAMSERDPYFWQDIRVLKNRLQIREAHRLQQAELELSALRAATIELGVPGLGFPHLRALHRTLFQDLYDWAGELRQIDIYMDDTPFCHFEYIEKEGNALMAALEAEKGLADLPPDQFIARMAHYYCEINMLHPFRDGNGRAQRLFFEQLALHAGYLIQWQYVDRDSWLKANRDGVSGDLRGLIDIFGKVVSTPA